MWWIVNQLSLLLVMINLSSSLLASLILLMGWHVLVWQFFVLFCYEFICILHSSFACCLQEYKSLSEIDQRIEVLQAKLREKMQHLSPWVAIILCVCVCVCVCVVVCMCCGMCVCVSVCTSLVGCVCVCVCVCTSLVGCVCVCVQA